jgi:3'-phosphoadenosine 5'-phosphosulfate (PAPS) 3'-phosphatase
MSIKSIVPVMEAAALGAGALLTRMQAETRRLASRKDFLTDADLRSEEHILRALGTQFPHIPAFSSATTTGASPSPS